MELPVPSSWFITGPKLEVRPRRTCVLAFTYEGEDANASIVGSQIIFEEVMAFKCTYLWGCSSEMIELGYDRLVDLGPTDWLKEIASVAVRVGNNVPKLHHLMIMFDDGPCYEFISKGYRMENLPRAPKRE